MGSNSMRLNTMRLNMMRLRKIGSKAFAAALAAAVVVTAVAPADAQTNRKRADRTAVVKHKGSRVIVTRRSYLDAGTEVLPGDRKFTQYIFPLGFMSYNPGYNNPSDPVGAQFYPLSDPFWPRW